MRLLAASLLVGCMIALLAQQQPQRPQSRVTYYIPGAEDTLEFWHSFNAEELSQVIAHDTAIYLLDVRLPKQFAKEHIAGSVNIPLADISKRMVELEAVRDADRNIIIIAAREKDARKLCEQLLQRKFLRLWYLRGGFQAWKKAGKPIANEWREQ